MAKFQLLECHVAIAGDVLNVVHRHAFIPVTFPELLCLKHIHGENAVTEIFEVGHVTRDEAAEHARLCDVYGAELIRERLFPGAAFRLPPGDDRYRVRTQPLAAPLPAEPDLPEPAAAEAPPPSKTPPAKPPAPPLKSAVPMPEAPGPVPLAIPRRPVPVGPAGSPPEAA